MSYCQDFYVKFSDDEGTVIIEKFDKLEIKCVDGKKRYELNERVIFNGEHVKDEIQAAIINRESFVNLMERYEPC